MKVFISWSGEKSKAIAKVLKWWIEKTSQTTQAFVSETDIRVGTRWSDRITNELAETQIGIICITPDNQNAPWINFEAGAISKAVDGVETKVAPVLIDFAEKADYSGPLREFHLCLLNKEGLKELATTINDSLPKPKAQNDVEETFDVWWDRLDAKIQDIHKAKPAPPQPRRDIDEVASEILDIVRDIQKRGHSQAGSQPLWGRTVEASLRGYGSLTPSSPDPSDAISKMLAYGQLIGNPITVGSSSDDHLVVVTDRPLTEEERAMIGTMAVSLPLQFRKFRFLTRSEEPTGEISAD